MSSVSKMIIQSFIALAFTAISFTAQAGDSELSTTKVPTTVPKVEINRYLGDWYEIASIPQSFSEGCECTRARYTLKKGHKVGVENTCLKKGKISRAKGTARVVDRSTNSKLRVTFFWPFSGQYWIIGLDKDYRYAVISNEKASTLWILSRTPVLDPALYQEALEIAEKNGVDTKKLLVTRQQACTYP